MKAKVLVPMSIEIGDSEIAALLFQRAWEIGRFGPEEDVDASLWRTDARGGTYINGAHWKVISDPAVAALVEAHHALLGRGLSDRRVQDHEIAAVRPGDLGDRRVGDRRGGHVERAMESGSRT